MLSTIDGYKTYLVMAALLLVVVLETGLGLDMPGVDVGSEWLAQNLAALDLGTLRDGIDGTNK
jgi:hypothetical protein